MKEHYASVSVVVDSSQVLLCIMASLHNAANLGKAAIHRSHTLQSYIDRLVQDRSNSRALAMELLQSCTNAPELLSSYTKRLMMLLNRKN